jgi:hypothetical protein
MSVMLPDTLPAPVATVTTDPHCSAQLDSGANHVQILPKSGATGTCVVQVHLTNGDTYGSSISYRSLGGCCAAESTLAESSTFMPIGASE